MSIFKILFGDPNLKVIKQIQPIVEEINKLEPEFSQVSSDELKNKTVEFRERLAKGELLDNLLSEAFALVREAAKRTIGQRHFDVQLIGGVVLHRGQIAEMKTGEGKTLTSTLAIYLNALEGKGVHVVTVNDYLAKRDTVWMGQIYHALGLSVGCIQQQMVSHVYEPGYEENSNLKTQISRLATENSKLESEEILSQEGLSNKVSEAMVKVEPSHLRPCARQEAYQCDITYGTNNEFGFDYLRDNMVAREEEMSQRALHYAIIDEVDSILVDEARTPLIISAPAEEATDKYYEFAELVNRLTENEDYNIDEKMRASTLTEAGIAKLEKWLGVANIYAEGGMQTVHHLEQALKARVLFKLDRDYVVKEGEIIIVDEFTGRLMFGRRYSEGLHQAIEAKEGVKIQRESQTLATVTFQNYFRLYKKIAGMTGTAATEAEEFAKIYKLEVVEVPTHRPMIRRDAADRIYKSEMGKFQAVVTEVKERNQKGQPVLIGTISIEKNELLSELLEREGIPHQILNAKNHEREAEIIAQAGRAGAVTLATNMAGRGVDIVLGGHPFNSDEAEKVREAGGLHVLGTERHESRRIDNQLRGRSGRQGDSGSSQFYVSLEDDLMRIFCSDRIKRMMEFMKMPEDMPIENKMVSRALESAQKKVESHNFDIRKHLLDYDDVLNKHRNVIYKKRREILEEYALCHPELVSGSPQNKDEILKQVQNDKLTSRIMIMVEQEIEQFVFFHTGGTVGGDWNIEEIYQTVTTIFPLSETEKEELFKISRAEEGRRADAEARTRLIDFLIKKAKERYEDLRRQINNPGLMLEMEKGILLRALDTLWVEHLVAIDYLRVGIGLRGYGQRDPLVEYKKESYRLFNELIGLIQKEVVYSIYKVGAALELAPSMMQRQGIQMSGAMKEAGTNGRSPLHRIAGGQKIGRNEPCPCGSGKKYKKCHGA